MANLGVDIDLLANRETSVYNAKLAEQAERYDEMADYMKEVVSIPQELSVDERNLLSVAYNNAVRSRRTAWRVITETNNMKGDKDNANFTREYCAKIENELDKICSTILELLNGNLLAKATNDESKAFYLKMKGDYYRYIAEVKSRFEEKKDATENAQKAYEQAVALVTGLAATHPIRLGLALNYSVFQFEVLGNPEKARDIAHKAFDDAVAGLDSLDKDAYKDASLVMQLLRDNLILWCAGEGDATIPEPLSGLACG